MHVQLSSLDHGIAAEGYINADHAYVTFTGKGPTTCYDALVLSANDPAVLVAALRDAADQVEAAARSGRVAV
jgi:hypothetical protein